MKPFDPIENLAKAKHELGEYGGVNMSIEASTTFTADEAHTLSRIFSGQLGPDMGGCYLYGRNFNPTVYALGNHLAALENTEGGYCTASGMSAIMAPILHFANTGDHLVVSNTIYGGTYALFNKFLPAKTGIESTFVDITDLDAVKKASKKNTKLIYTETLSNPTLKLADIAALKAIASGKDLKLIVDNTFCPLIITPSLFGADVIIHSLTKFINGSSDMIAGSICSDKDTIRALMDLEMGPLMVLGPTLDPKQAFNICMRLAHLPLRMQEHSRRALYISQKLEKIGVNVSYPGLKSHPQHALFDKMANKNFGYGGIFTIEVESEAKANRLMEELQSNHFGYLAVSLGYYETLMSCSGSSTSSELPDSEKDAAGIAPGLIRFSIGLTGTLEQRWKQLEEALQRVG